MKKELENMDLTKEEQATLQEYVAIQKEFNILKNKMSNIKQKAEVLIKELNNIREKESKLFEKINK